jgi:hypothetical protein
MAKHLARRRASIKKIAIPTVVVAVVALGIAGAASANLSGSTFEGNDGNLVVNTAGNTDWANVAGRNTGIDNPSGGTDNAFGQGTKEDDPNVTVVDGSIPPNKNDLTRFYEASQQASNGDIFLDLAWERLVNIGNANLDFEINQNPTPGFTGATTGPVTLNRTAGDLLVTYDFSGSGTPTLGLNTWLTAAAGNTVSQCLSANSLPCWGKHVSLNGTDSEGAVNTAPVTEPFLNTTLGTGLFGEAAINLTAAGVFPLGVCKAFGSAFVKSRSSSSFTAEVKDFVAPVGVQVSNCGTITIHKVTENGDSSFGYTTTGGLSPSTFSLSNGGQQQYQPVNTGNYSVTENLTTAQQTAGWTLKSLTCTATGSGTSATPSGSTVNITMGLAGNVDCTYTNHINFKPTIATTLSATTANIGDTIHDSATLTGASPTAGGTVTYHAYAGQNTCTGTDLLNSTVTVTNGVVPDSANFTPSAAGYYSFQAVYSGDGNNDGATSVCSTEQLLVKTNPSITTTLSAAPVPVGSIVHDSASLNAASSDAGGTVTYTVYTNDTCTQGARDAGTVTVTNGVVPDSNGLAFNSAGTFYWQAVYSGDTKNNSATSACTTETLVVNPLGPSIATTLSSSSIPVGGSVHDSATLTGTTPDAGGTVTYTVYTNNTCTQGARDAGTVTVTNGSVADSNSLAFNSAGTFYWQAAYSGDNNNNPASSVCTSETLVVSPLGPSIATSLSANNVPVGSSVHDSATLTGASPDGGGTVTYTVYTNNTCTEGARDAGTVTVTNGSVPDSNSLAFNSAGTFYWQAAYSGDNNNNPASSVCTSETLVVSPLGPSISTALSSPVVDVGSSVHDSATLSGATPNAGGTVTYTVYTNDTCTQGARDAGTVTVTNGSVPDSSSLTFNNAGTFYWQAAYSGDPNNSPATSLCTSETLIVNKLKPTNSTAQNLIPNDNFTLSGGFNPTGTITFNLYAPGDATCSGTPALTQTVSVNGNGTYETTNTSFIATTEGTWRWASSYTGDANNEPTSSSCGTEQFTILNH